jgi:hypothetical protein
LPNENRQRSKKRNSKREFTTSFAHSLVKGPKFQYLCKRERVKKFKERNKGRKFECSSLFSLLFNSLLSLLAIWSDFSVFEKKVEFGIVEGKLLITITICSCFLLVLVSHIERTKQGSKKREIKIHGEATGSWEINNGGGIIGGCKKLAICLWLLCHYWHCCEDVYGVKS